MRKNKSLIKEVFEYLKLRKGWWYVPTIVLLVIVGVVIVLGQGTALSPFIYVMF